MLNFFVQFMNRVSKEKRKITKAKIDKIDHVKISKFALFTCIFKNTGRINSLTLKQCIYVDT